MATTTEKGFKVPGYADKADVPRMVKDNVETAEQHLKAISKSMSTYHLILIRWIAHYK